MAPINQFILLGSGTSQGVPVIGCDCKVCSSNDPKDNRTRTSAYIQVNGVHLVIDTGPDFRTQMLREGLSKVDAVLFTHEHQDHMAGLDDVRPMIFRSGNAMSIFGQSRVINRIKKAFHYAFEKQPYPGAPRIDSFEIDENEPFTVGGIEIIPIPLDHGNLPILGYRIGDLAFLTDVNHVPPASMAKLIGIKTLFLDALHHKNHFSHFTLEQAVSKATEIGAEKTYFIHMSHYMGTHQATMDSLHPGMELAYDGLKVDLSYSASDR